MRAWLLSLVVLVGIVGAAGAQSPPKNIATAQVSVGATATLVAAFRGTRANVTIQNHGATAMYCSAGTGVLTTTGFRLPGVDGASITIPTSSAVYCITAAGSQTVSVLESYF